MRVILRKNDSATSILLFTYNNYLTHFNKDKVKLANLLEVLKAFGKNETAIRMSLSRAVKAGMLINKNESGEVSYLLTSGGKDAIGVWNEGMRKFWERYALRHIPWDGKWHLINIELGEKQKDERTAILEGLQQSAFGMLSTNTWISPYNQSTSSLLEGFDLGSVMVKVDGHVTVSNINMFLERVFDLEKLVQPYEFFIKTFREKLNEMGQISKDEWFVQGGHALPVLHELGRQFFKVAAEDVMLPKELCPEWVGDEAAQLMREFRELLLKPTLNFIRYLESK
jgi:phenylacetic acid degradation operon negative regulatory protein